MSPNFPYILVIAVVLSGSLTEANNRPVDWQAVFETNQSDLHVNERKQFNLVIKNLQIANYHDSSVNVISSDARIVRVSNVGFVYNFGGGTWRGTFIATPVGVGSVNISVEVDWGSQSETSNESMRINVHRNRIMPFSSWIFQYVDLSITVIFYITIGMVLEWSNWYDIVRRPAGLCDAFLINIVIMLMVSSL